MTENGWEPSPRIDPNSPLLVWKQVPGADVTIQVRNDDAGTLMLAYAADYHATVEPLRDAETACYTPTNSVDTSNHLNATAMDFDWNSYPWKVRGNLTGDKLARLRDLLAFYNPWMYWAGDWDDAYVDEMHHQMNYGTYELAQQGKLSQWVKANIRPDGFSLYKRGPMPGQQPPAPLPVPAPTPVADPRAAAITALYDAVPVIDEARAAQLVDAVTAGLAAAQCTNVKRIAMFLAQTGWESDGYQTTEEYADGSEYEGRCSDLGNCSPGDGVKYKGRTWIQITGKAHYAEFGKWSAGQGLVDDPNQFVNDPTSLGDIKWAGIGAAWYWTVARPGINTLCDAGDLVGVTKAINGGTNGLEDPRPGVPGRRTRYQQAIALGDELLALLPAPPTDQGDDVLAALTPTEQHELLDGVRWLKAQLGPTDPSWGADSSLGQDDKGNELTVRDGLAELKRYVEAKAPTK